MARTFTQLRVCNRLAITFFPPWARVKCAHQAFSEPMNASASDLNEAALARWLTIAVPSVGTLTDVRRFAGGQSNPTYRLDTEHGALVLRRKPFGQLLPSAHAVDREFRLISALYPTGFPVPRPVALCADEAVVGSMFYVMELVEGEVFWDGELPGLAPTDRRPVYDALVDTLARLHRIPIEEVGLANFGRPGNYFARQVERWSRQYSAAQTEPSAKMDRLMASLAASVPAQERVAILHGDYRIDNIVLAPGRPTVAAVLDWELSTLGDPLADFAYLALNWAMPHDLRRSSLGGLDLRALEIPTLDEVTERYCSASGLKRPPQLDWYFAFNLFRGVSIAQGIKKRVLDGNAAGDDADATKAVESLPNFIDAALEFAARAGALEHANRAGKS